MKIEPKAKRELERLRDEHGIQFLPVAFIPMLNDWATNGPPQRQEPLLEPEVAVKLDAALRRDIDQAKDRGEWPEVTQP